MEIIIKFGLKKINNIKKIIIWDEVDYTESELSIINYIEKNDIKIRKKFLEEISQLTNIKNNNFIKKYSINKNYNLWELSTFVEKSIYKSDKFIINSLKLLALQDIVQETQIKEIIINQASHEEKKNIIRICKKKNVKVSFNKIILTKHLIKKSYIFNIFKSLAYLPYYLYKNFDFINRIKINTINNFKSNLLIQSYFSQVSYLDENYYSDQWSYLPKMLNSNKIKSTYIHFNIFDGLNNKKSIKLINKFNLNKYEYHFFLQDFLSIRIIYKCFKLYMKTIFINIISHINIKKSLIKKDFIFSNFYLIKPEIIESLYGLTCIKNILNILLIDKMFEVLDTKKNIIYLQEFQSWEKIFLRASLYHKHGKTFGYQHAISRFWDLRYFNSHDMNINPKLYNLTLPSFVIVNGPFSKNNLLLQKYKNSKIISVETTRFLEIFSKKKKSKTNNKNILILGDYEKSYNDDFFRNLSKNLLNFKNHIFYYKSHPSVKEIINYNFVNMINRTTPIDDIVDNFSMIIIIGASTTSFAYFYSTAIIYIYRPSNNLDYNVFKNIDGLKTVNDLSLIDLNLIRTNNRKLTNVKNIFNFNIKKSKWLSFIDKYLK